MSNKEFYELYDLIVTEPPHKSDVIVWLQGDRFDRGPKVVELYEKKTAPKILISGNNILIGIGKRPGEDNVSLKEMFDWLLDNKVKENDILVDDISMNTKDQAINVINLAKKNEWKNIILVGSSFYQPRAFLTFLKEAQKQNFNGKVFNQPVIIDVNIIPSGRVKTAKYLIEDEINKILEYKDDLESINSGIKYLNKYVN